MKKEKDALGETVARSMHGKEGTARAWGLRFDDAGDGWARCSMTIRDDMLNGHGIAHGGMIFSLADTAFAWACNSGNAKTVAQHASISFLSAVEPGEVLIAEARRRAEKGRSGVYDVTVMAGDGRAVAVFQGLSRAIGGKVIESKD